MESLEFDVAFSGQHPTGIAACRCFGDSGTFHGASATRRTRGFGPDVPQADNFELMVVMDSRQERVAGYLV